MILKTNLHFHTGDDKLDNLPYTAFEAIDQSAKLGFEVLSFTLHKYFIFKKEWADYAAGKNILLIPGIEAEIEKKHVVIINCDGRAEKLKTFEDLRRYRKEKPDIFVIAAHPFVLSPKSLRKKLFENISLFDAIEISVFSNKIFKFNEKAIKAAERYHKPLIATSDTHQLNYLNMSYALIDCAEKNIDSVLTALKNGSVKNHNIPMNIWKMAWHQVSWVIHRVLKNYNPLLR